jgi:Flp pilus assembly protein TadG
MSLLVRIRRRRETPRRGAAAVELAICLPLLVLLVMASIEACTMIFLDHSLTIASYEGVRAGINYDGTNADVLARANAIINSRDIQGAQVTIDPPDVESAERGETIAVTVSAPCNLNMVIPPWFYDGRTLRSTMTMVKE